MGTVNWWVSLQARRRPDAMSIAELCQQIQDSTIGVALLESQYVWLIVESVHVLSLALSVGLLALTDLSLIGYFRRQYPLEATLRPLRPWMLGGFALMFVSGGLLFWSEAATVYATPWFKWKMVFLLVAGLNALVFEWRLRGRPVQRKPWQTPPLSAKLAGWVSLLCWALVIICGRWVAYAHT